MDYRKRELKIIILLVFLGISMYFLSTDIVYLNINSKIRICLGIVFFVIFFIGVAKIEKAVYPATKIKITSNNLDDLYSLLKKEYNLYEKENNKFYDLEKYSCNKKTYIYMININSKKINLEELYTELVEKYDMYLRQKKIERDLVIIFNNNYSQSEIIFSRILKWKNNGRTPTNTVVPIFIHNDESFVVVSGIKYNKFLLYGWYKNKISNEVTRLFNIKK